MKKAAIIIITAISLSCHAPERRTLCIFPSTPVYYLRPDEVLARLRAIGIKYPTIVWRQVMLETGWGKSQLATQGKNLFGMKHTERGWSLGWLWGHAHYASFDDGISDYKEWQDRYYRGGDYYEFLRRIGYAGDEFYIDKLKQIR